MCCSVDLLFIWQSESNMCYLRHARLSCRWSGNHSVRRTEAGGPGGWGWQGGWGVIRYTPAQPHQAASKHQTATELNQSTKQQSGNGSATQTIHGPKEPMFLLI